VTMGRPRPHLDRLIILGSVLLSLVAGAARAAPGGPVPVDESPLPIEAVVAFPQLRIPRPLIITHAGDGVDRLIIGSQYGELYIVENRPDVDRSQVLLDIRQRVVYKDSENEEGLLGLAFHPRFRDNGQFFVYYTTTDAPHTSVISRFRLASREPLRADPDSEEEILRIREPYWNHNGGTLVFGPDGYLYIALGDGGAANDPQGNGQNLGTLLGSILRIDVDRKEGGRAYAIPPDNPFVDRAGARPEIWAYGLRNVWRMAFDPPTGRLWAADVGQDLWEEIDLIQRGGNYGWNLREGRHRFGLRGTEARSDLIEPIWEYYHSVGRSITGGFVYRGSLLPELAGAYLYGDYVSGRLWALRYDAEHAQVVANHPLGGPSLPMLTFGADVLGEAYFGCELGGGTIYTFRRK
jgi:glucose/arabinose dehydrogenase